MHAVITGVQFDPAQGGEEAAVDVLHKNLIPQVKQLPGFIKAESGSVTKSPVTDYFCSRPP